MKYDTSEPGPMVVTIPRGSGPVTLTPHVPVTVVQAPAILYTPEGIPYSADPPSWRHWTYATASGSRKAPSTWLRC